MTCLSVEARLGAYMDGELSGSEMLQVRAHLAQCDRCMAMLDQHRELKLSLASMADMPPSPEVEEKVIALVMGTARERQRTIKAPVAFALVAMAAASWLISLAVQSNHQATVEAQRVQDQQAFEMARHQTDVRRSDPLMGDSGVLLVNYGR